MPRGLASIEIAAPCDVVFELVHDYQRRLEWDTMLSQARLLGGATRAGLGVRSLCVGTWSGAFLALETEYIQFDPGRRAAVRLSNRPPCFARFAATIRHDSLGEARSRTTYIYSFRARPASLAPLLEPIMGVMLHREVRLRLQSLRRFSEREWARGSHHG